MRLARSTGTVSGLLLIVLGVWGALIPFVGPYFDYSFSTNSTWHYTSDRLWLCILPGALTVLGGLLLIAAGTRAAGVFGGWLALVSGAWFVVGPAVSLTWEHGQGPIGRPLFGSTRQAFELIGYFYGLGALIVAVSAFAIGRFLSRPRLAEAAAVAPAADTRRPVATRTAADEGVRSPAPERSAAATGASAAPAAETESRPRRRLHFPRRSRSALRRGEGDTVER
jgi:hypothetical protein